MGFKDKLQRLQRAAQGHLKSIELEDGTRYWYDPAAVRTEVFRHATKSLLADYKGEKRPEAPQILKAISQARDRRTALETVFEEPWKAFLLTCPC